MTPIMYGASGHAVFDGMGFRGHSLSTQNNHFKHGAFNANANQHYQHTEQQCKAGCFKDNDSIVDVSMDLLQYMSESLDIASTSCHQHPQAVVADKCGDALHTCLTVGSGCSSHSGHMLPESPAYCKHTQQCQQPPSSSSSCHSDCAVPLPVLSSSSTCSTAEHLQQQQPAGASGSSVRSYSDDFVWQCYYGNPSSDANRQQQRPMQASPFAAYATFPGFPDL